MEARRILAGVTLALTQTSPLLTGVPITLPVDRTSHAVNVGVNPNFCRFTFKGDVKDVTLNYVIGYKTTRLGTRVEPALHLGLLLNSKLVVSGLAQEPFYIDTNFSGIRGTLVLREEFKYGDNLDVVIINKGISCDCEFRSIEVNLFDGAPSSDSGQCASREYVHDQGVPANTWNVIHNLGFYPSVTTVDTLKRQWEGAVTYIDENTLKITFNNAFSGKAFLS